MINEQTGGPAFPCEIIVAGTHSGLHKTPWQGMTLRDYFAAKAMQGMYTAHKFPSGIIIDTAKEAYEMADAMLKAREQ
jgi:hypothetical protein